MPLKDPVSEIHGRQEDNSFKAAKTHNHKDKALDRPPSIWQPLRNHGTINLSLWTWIEPECQEESGEDEEGDSPEEMLPEQKT